MISFRNHNIDYAYCKNLKNQVGFPLPHTSINTGIFFISAMFYFIHGKMPTEKYNSNRILYKPNRETREYFGIKLSTSSKCMCFSSTASSFRSVYAFSFLIENIAETIQTTERIDTMIFDVFEFEAQEK